MNLLPRMERIGNLHRHRAIAVALALLAAWALLVTTDLVGTWSWIGLVATVTATVVVAASSDSFAGLILLGAMSLQWLLSGPGTGSWWVLPAAWLLLIAHVAVALAASGPDQAAIPGSVAARWTRRTAVVGLATTVVGALALLVQPVKSGLMPYAVAAALAALAVGAVVILRLTGDPELPGSHR